MNLSLIDKILSSENGFLATIIETEGHTYQKQGARALFQGGGAIPVHGNLGSLCADDEIVAAGSKALSTGLPRCIDIDTTDPADGQLGYGTACGGRMSLLVEPIRDEHRAVYRELAGRMRGGRSAHLVHDMASGEISLGDDVSEPGQNVFVETIAAPSRVILFGATPLSRRLCTVLDDLHVSLHVVDWRPAQLDALADLPRVERVEGELALTGDDIVIILSHSYERDKDALTAALTARCRYIGLLSSKTRRDGMYRDLAEAGFGQSDFSAIHSPVGLNIGARSDAEIALSIAAELVGELSA